jgi:hypothetical protein
VLLGRSCGNPALITYPPSLISTFDEKGACFSYAQ